MPREPVFGRSARKPQPSIQPFIPSDDQIGRIIEMSTTNSRLDNLHDIVVIVENTGIRAGEFSSLRVADTDLSKCRLFIRSASTACGGRYLYFSPAARSAFEALIARHHGSEYILGDHPRQMIRHVSLQLRAIRAGLNSSRFTLHSLRRTFARRLAQFGMSSESRSCLLGLRGRW